MIRKATENDIDGIMNLLLQVHRVHSTIRPDLFKQGETKYTEKELLKVLKDKNRPVFVYDDNGIKGYAFCILEDFTKVHSLNAYKSLYIDDLCTDEKERGKGIAHKLYEFVKDYAKEQDCYNLTLNVWEGNDNAKRFYKSLGMTTQKTVMETIL